MLWLSLSCLALPMLGMASPGVRYKARVVAGAPVLPEHCDTLSCDSQPVPMCWLKAALERPIKEASTDGVDIIVFPETYFSDSPQLFHCQPPAQEKLLPEASSKSLCPVNGQPDTWWRQVACWAKEYHILVVVGAYEWGACLPSPNPFTHRAFPCFSNLTVFNQAHAFGVDGQLLAVHHKHHLAHAMIPKSKTSTKLSNGLIMNPSPLQLFDDDAAASWPVPYATVFTSHFGVTFGIVICHELNFASPILTLLRAGVRDIIFPTKWGGMMEGSFQGLQNGFALSHGVNLISANGDSGGSGIWPAHASLDPVQYPTSASSGVVPKPQWFGTLELESPMGPSARQVAVPPPSAHRLVSNVSQLKVTSVIDGRAYNFEVSLPGTTCHLELSKLPKGSRYLFGASNGINFAGLFESSCWLVGCSTIVDQLYGQLSPTFLEQAFWPFTDGDIDFCAKQHHHHVTASEDTQLRIDIKSASSNFFVPDGQCNNGTVPLPRPFVERSHWDGWQAMSLTAGCQLGIAAVRSFAQSEFELPQCPDGFCPSPSICSNKTWETESNELCTLVPAVPREFIVYGEKAGSVLLV